MHWNIFQMRPRPRQDRACRPQNPGSPGAAGSHRGLTAVPAHLAQAQTSRVAFLLPSQEFSGDTRTCYRRSLSKIQ